MASLSISKTINQKGLNERSYSKTTMNSVKNLSDSLSPATSTMMLASVVVFVLTMTGTVHGAYENGLVDHLVPVDYVTRVTYGAGGPVDERRSMQTSDNGIEYNDDSIEEYDPGKLMDGACALTVNDGGQKDCVQVTFYYLSFLFLQWH